MKRKIILSILCMIVLMGVSGCGSNNQATHQKVELTDSNYSEYLTIDLQGRLTDYSGSYYRGIRFSGSIKGSSTSYEFQNVSFKLDLVIYETYSNAVKTRTFTKNVYLDNGGNYNILENHDIEDGEDNGYNFRGVAERDIDRVGYSYKISNVKGYVIVPKKIIE